MHAYTEEEVIERFTKFGEIKKETERTGNFRKGNRAVDKMVKVFAYLYHNKELAQKTLSKLIYSDNEQTRIWAATCCLSFGVCIEEAVAVLEQDKKNDQLNGMVQFSAEMALKQWRKGELIMYQGQREDTN